MNKLIYILSLSVLFITFETQSQVVYENKGVYNINHKGLYIRHGSKNDSTAIYHNYNFNGSFYSKGTIYQYIVYQVDIRRRFAKIKDTEIYLNEFKKIDEHNYEYRSDSEMKIGLADFNIKYSGYNYGKINTIDTKNIVVCKVIGKNQIYVLGENKSIIYDLKTGKALLEIEGIPREDYLVVSVSSDQYLMYKKSNGKIKRINKIDGKWTVDSIKDENQYTLYYNDETVILINNKNDNHIVYGKEVDEKYVLNKKEKIASVIKNTEHIVQNYNEAKPIDD